MRSHQVLDQRSLDFHRLVAARLRSEPERFDRVQQTLERWLIQVDERSRPYLLEWQAACNQGLETALALATDPSEHATALRQSTPFVGVLSHRERAQFFKTWKP